ncbi:MAG: helix-turn-helix domain-containing protein [Patescibacteria group bacterium]
MTAIFDNLQKLGLTENQTVLYLALAKAGSAKAGELIKQTGMHRNIVYTALEELVEKKLITSARERGILMFKLLSPTRLLADVEEKERIAKHAIEELSHLTKKNRQEVIVYEGIDEFRRHVVRSYELAEPGALHRYLGTSPHWHAVVGLATEKEVTRIQREKRLRLRGIAKTSFPQIRSLLAEGNGLTELRFNPLIGSDTNNVEILQDRICIQTFTEPYTVVEIINAELAKNYQNYFDFLWKASK